MNRNGDLGPGAQPLLPIDGLGHGVCVKVHTLGRMRRVDPEQLAAFQLRRQCEPVEVLQGLDALGAGGVGKAGLQVADFGHDQRAGVTARAVHTIGVPTLLQRREAGIGNIHRPGPIGAEIATITGRHRLIKQAVAGKPVNRHAILTPDRRPILTPMLGADQGLSRRN